MRKFYKHNLPSYENIRDINALTEDDIIFKLDSMKCPLKRVKRPKVKRKTYPHQTPTQWQKTLPVGVKLSVLEYEFIFRTLESQGWNRTKAAYVLGISIRSIRNKIQELKAIGYQVVSH